MKGFLFGADNNGPSTSVQEFNRLNAIFPSSWTGNETLCRLVAPVAMDLSRFYVQVDVAPGAGKSYTFTVMKNGAATSLEVVIADSATSGTDTTHAVSFAPGDTISLRSTPSGTPTAPNNEYWNVQVDTSGQFAPMLTCLASMSTSLTQYASLLAGHSNAAGWTTTEANLQVVVPAAGTLSNLYVKTSGAPGSGKSYELTMMKNGAATSLQAILAGTNTLASDTANTVSVAAGDTLTIRAVPISSPAGVTPSFGFTFTPTNVGENFMGFGSASTPSTSVNSYEQLLGIGNQAWSSTESARYMMPGPCTLRGLNVKIGTAPGVGKSYTFTIRKSTGDTALSVTISDNNTTGSVSGNVECAQGELILTKCVPSGTPTTTTGGVHIGLLLYADPKTPVVVMY